MREDLERVKGWQSDIDLLLKLMKEQHYVYRSQPLPAELLAKAIDLKENAAGFSDERMLTELEKLMFYMHDGHSYVLPTATKRPPAYCLPLRFYLFEDGVYLIDADEPYRRWIGWKVEQIHGIRVEQIIEDMHTYIHQDNQHTVKWFAPTVMRFRGIYEMYGLPALAPDMVLTLKDRGQHSVAEKIEFVPAAELRGIPKLIPSQLPEAPPAPLYLTRVSTHYWFENYPESSMLYFQFNQVRDAQDETIAQFSARLGRALAEGHPRLLIIDVRHNNGGNLGLLGPLMAVIQEYEESAPQARIVAITGRNTFSAAQVFISLLDRDTHTLFAGEPSSSRPNFVGEEGNMFVLPWSGATGNISTLYHETIPGDDRQWIEPDFVVTLSSRAYFANQDPVMDFLTGRFLDQDQD